MLEVGLTGGIGAGKTTVAELFMLLKVPIYNSDVAAKKLVNSDLNLKNQITELFGVDTYEGGLMIRSKVAEIVFSDSSLLQKLNDIIHPAVAEDYQKWKSSFKYVPYVMKETAILHETGIYNRMDIVVSVSAPEKMRIQRVIKRDNISNDMVMARMSKQWTQFEKNRNSDYIIFNDSTAFLTLQVLNCHKFLLNKSR